MCIRDSHVALLHHFLLRTAHQIADVVVRRIDVAERLPGKADRADAVSYTHLDVYKRQVLSTPIIENRDTIIV